MASTLKFCGRNSEFDTLIDRWRLASDVEDPKPQVVVIQAGRGIGKTRLAVEFYRWLSENMDTSDRSGYWPDTVQIVGRNLEVNPDRHRCNFEVPIPYLWWGLRAGDPGDENGVVGDAIATYDKFLAPHLVALLVRARMKNRVWEIAKAWGSVGLDVTSSALQIDNILSIGRGLASTVNILEGSADHIAYVKAKEQSLSRATAVLSDMERAFNPAIMTYAGTPGVIFLDDAQFAHEDAALPSFVERLMHTAIMQRWPILIIVTHWKDQLSRELMPDERSFAGIFFHAREGSPTDKGPAADLPGGYLTNENFQDIDLGPVDDLSLALSESLPGLKKHQSAAILERADGNPRFLEQIIALTLGHRSYFENRSFENALTKNGLRNLLNKSVRVHSVVFDRLSDAPEEVKVAVASASPQGVRFANSIADEIAKITAGTSGRQGLAQAEDPYNIVTGALREEEVIGAFSERLFYEVALELREEIESIPGGGQQLEAALRDVLIERLENPDFRQTHSEEDRAMTYGLVANLFEHSTDPQERNLAQKALGELAWLELSRYSFESAAAAYERLLAIEPHSLNASERVSRIETWDRLATIYRNLNWPAKAASAFRKIFWEATGSIPDGFDTFLRSGDRDAAREHFGRWKQEHSDWPPDSYIWVVRSAVSALLNLSELAHARPDLRIEEGDDSLGDAPFLVRTARELVDVSEDNEDTTIPEHLVQANYLREWAYAQNGVLGEGEVEKEHFRLLENLARSAHRDGDLPSAEGFLLRALQISQDLGDDLNQIATLSNLGMIAGEQEDFVELEKCLEQARTLVETILSEKCFHVNLVVDAEGADSDSINSRKVGSVDVPVRYSDEFDNDPDAVVDKVWKLKQFAANIYGNLATSDQQRGNFSAAKEGFISALRIHEEINDKEGAAIDLQNLAKIAHVEGDTDSACSYWAQCVKVFRELEHRDAGTLFERRWAEAIEDMLDGMRAAGCSDEDITTGRDPNEM